jgi:YD repeat-containing protein
MMLRTSGAVEGSVPLPASVGAEKFDPQLQAVVTKEAGGGYEVADATGETDTAVAFDDEGKVEELRTEGLAKVDYSYEEGALAEIAVEDPAVAPTPEPKVEEPSTYQGSFGAEGTGNGQFKRPADVAIDADHNIWVVDRENHRIQKFDGSGQFIKAFGSQGSENGQLSWPSAIAIDPEGDVWVADRGNHRVQQFNQAGEFISKFGVTGGGAGQLFAPEGLAVDAKGNIWVATPTVFNIRVQKFSPSGELLKMVGANGSGPGQFNQPAAIAVGPEGNVLVADRGNNRVQVFSEAGDFVRQWKGWGDAAFTPSAIDVDEQGTVWVGDIGKHRVLGFTAYGDLLAQFGSQGSGGGQFNLSAPVGLEADPSGDVWLADSGNHRLEKWLAVGDAPPESEGDDPSVGITVENGLVSAVEGEEAGQNIYTHESDLLTAYVGPQGETEYEYDQSGRMTRVELPNGTWAEIEYGSDGRVKSVTVDPAGAEPEKTTSFTYVDQPRKTTVVLPDAPAVTYEIGNDGSVLKWQNALKAPEFEDIAGTLYDVENKETVAPIKVGDYNLSIQAYSDEGIASIQIYANGNQLVSEKTCPEVYKEPAKCIKLPDEWVTYTGNHAPGILYLEMVIEDRIGQVASERFWANIPYTPPPPPDQPATPKFAEVLQFREEHGLDLDLDPIQDELEINDRVFDTINDWVQGNPVAVASMERWGAPLRTPEVAELEWRLQYWEQASQALPTWVAANAASTFAGHYLDERAGGKIVVGFTGGQAAATLAALEQNGGLIAGPDRIVPPVKAPQHTLAFLESLESQISAAAAGYPVGLIRRVRVDIPSNTVKVGASNVSQAQSLLQGSFGAQAPITVFFDPNGLEKKDARQRITGAMRAGDEIWTAYHNGGGYYGECTASFGAFERAKKPSTGESVLRMFVLAAGHCAELKSITQRRNGESGGSLYQDIGEVRRSGYETISDEAVDTDVAAIRLEQPGITPRKIYQQDGLPLVDVTSVWTPTPGTNLCFSGRTSKERRCGPMIGSGIAKANYTEEEKGLFGREGCFRQFIWGGDSGSPVWVEGTGVAVGVAVRGTDDPNDPEFRPELENEVIERLIKEHGQYTVQQFEEAMKIEEKLLIENRETCFVPLKPPPNTPGDGTVFGDPMLAPLHLVTRSNAND